MPVTEKWAYFDHAAVAPLPSNSASSIQKWLDQATLQGDTCWLEWAAQLDSLRNSLGTLFGADPCEIALIPNTSTGISIVAEGLDWKEGDNVVFPENEFPSNSLPWRHLQSRGVEFRTLKVDPRPGSPSQHQIDFDRLDELIDARTRLVSLSWVGFSNGFRVDLDEACERIHARGALVFIDGIQGAGVFPLDLAKTPIDFFAADGHKWMLGPEGAGFLFVRKELIERIRPILVGWGSVQNASQFSATELQWKKGASRFEPGSPNMVGMIGLNASVRLLLNHGADRSDSPIAEAILENASILRDALRSKGALVDFPSAEKNGSGIVSFEIPDRDPVEIRKKLLEQGVVVSVRNGKLRASTHAYNNQDDIERLVRGW